MSVDKILDRLEGVRKTSTGKWLARCPAHDDRHASFSVKETEDGKILCHCFAGCSVEDVLAAIGLDMSDLYPERISQPGQAGAKIPKFNASEIVKCLAAGESLMRWTRKSVIQESVQKIII